jgi:hypothetical protein
MNVPSVCVAELKLSYNADRTISVRVGRAVEHVSVDGKTKGELWDAVKWLAISKGARFSDVEITEALQAVLRDDR